MIPRRGGVVDSDVDYQDTYGSFVHNKDSVVIDNNTRSYNKSTRFKNYNDLGPSEERTFNAWTRNEADSCEYQNKQQINRKPLKYYTNNFNNMGNPEQYASIGNRKVYQTTSTAEIPAPSRLNPVYPTYMLPYSTTPNYANVAPSRLYIDTDSSLRTGTFSREKKSANTISEIDYNRWEILSTQTVKNPGAYGNSAFRSNAQGLSRDSGISVNNSNIEVPLIGISSRNMYHNSASKSCGKF